MAQPQPHNKWSHQMYHKRQNRRQYASKHYDQFLRRGDIIFKRKDPVKQRKNRKRFKRQRNRKKTLKRMAFDFDDFVFQNKNEDRRRIQTPETDSDDSESESAVYEEISEVAPIYFLAYESVVQNVDADTVIARFDNLCEQLSFVTAKSPITTELLSMAFCRRRDSNRVSDIVILEGARRAHLGLFSSDGKAPTVEETLCLIYYLMTSNSAARREQIGELSPFQLGCALHAVVGRYLNCESNNETDIAAKWLRLFEIMLRRGAQTSATKRKNMGWSIYRGHHNEQSVLDRVIKSRSATLCDLVFDHGVDIESALDTHSRVWHSEAFSNETMTPIHSAIALGDCGTLRRLLLRGASLDARKTKEYDEPGEQTALFSICEGDDADCSLLKAALSADTTNFNVNAWNGGMGARHHWDEWDERMTALYVAVSKRNIEMVKLLLVHGANPSHCARKRRKGPYDEHYRYEEQQGPELTSEIAAILHSDVRWFPELLDFYPRRVRQSLSVIRETLSAQHFPADLLHIIVDYFGATLTATDAVDEEEDEDEEDEDIMSLRLSLPMTCSEKTSVLENADAHEDVGYVATVQRNEFFRLEDGAALLRDRNKEKKERRREKDKRKKRRGSRTLKGASAKKTRKGATRKSRKGANLCWSFARRSLMSSFARKSSIFVIEL